MGACSVSIGVRAPGRPFLVVVRIAVVCVAVVLGLVANDPDRAVAAPLPADGTVDLLSEAGAQLTGLAESDLAGWSVAGAGDVNGDGLDDMIVGAPDADREDGDRGAPRSVISEAGAAYVVFGAPPAAPTDLGALGTGALPGFPIKGAVVEDRAGWSVAGAGDVNGDGLDDVIVGAPFADREGGGRGAPRSDLTDAGAAYVIFGKASLDAVDLTEIGAPGNSQGIRIVGGSAGDGAGYSVSGAGDVNGDGRPDAVVGATGVGTNGDGAGAAYVVFTTGVPGTVNLGSLGGAGFRIDGAATWDTAGWSVAGIGDMSGDGRSEVIVGAPFADPGGEDDAGSAYVVFGEASSTAVNLASLGANGFRVDGARFGNNTGWSVARTGDLNGDRLPEAVVGAPLAGTAPGHTGSGYVVFGRASTAAVDLASPGSSAFEITGGGWTGWSVASSGDLNGDGREEVFLGAPYANHDERLSSGTAHAVFGQAGTSPIDATALMPGSFRVDGAASGDHAGWSVAGAGDVNGDGGPDLIVGAPYAHAGGAAPRGEGAGAAYVIHGPAPPGPGPSPQPGPLGPAPLQAAATVEECAASLRRPLPSVTHWAVIRGGLRLRLKVAPGGYVVRPDREARFIVQVQRADRKARSYLRRVAFSLDGRRLTTDRRAPYTAAIGPGTLSAGSHLLRATAYPSRGGGRTLRLRFQASDCEAAAFSTSMISKVPGSLADLELRVQSGGPELASATFALPRALRVRPAGLGGRRVGTIQLVGKAGATTRKALTVGRRRGGAVSLLGTGSLNVRLARRSGRAVISVTGLKDLRATGVRVVLNGRRTGLLRNPGRCARHRFAAELTSAGGDRVTLKRSLRMCKGR